MITITIEAILRNVLPDEYYQSMYCLYIVRDAARVIYVGKAENQSTLERLIQHLATDTTSDFFSRLSGPSELGKYILTNAPESYHWFVDLLALDECKRLSNSDDPHISINEAERLLIQQYIPLLNRTYNSERPTPPVELQPNQTRLLPAYSAEFLGTIKGSYKTQDAYRSALLRFQQYAEEKKLTNPTAPLLPERLYKEALADFLARLQADGLRNNTIRTYIAAIKQFLLWLQAKNRLPDGLRVDDLQRILEQKAGPHLRSIPPERHQVDEAIGQLLGYYAELLKAPIPDSPRGRRQKLAYTRNHAILQTLYSTAGRASEVASLTRSQIEGSHTLFTDISEVMTQTPLISIEINGRGGRKRLIFLAPDAQLAIQAYLVARYEAEKQFANDSHNRCDALFVRHDRDAITAISTKTVWLIVQEAAKAVFGCDAEGRPLQRVGPHDFRHLRAQHLYEAGMPLDTIQIILGHSSVITTRKIYTGRASAERLARELEQYSRKPTPQANEDGILPPHAVRKRLAPASDWLA